MIPWPLWNMRWARRWCTSLHSQANYGLHQYNHYLGIDFVWRICICTDFMHLNLQLYLDKRHRNKNFQVKPEKYQWICCLGQVYAGDSYPSSIPTRDKKGGGAMDASCYATGTAPAWLPIMNLDEWHFMQFHSISQIRLSSAALSSAMRTEILVLGRLRVSGERTYAQ